MFVEATLDSGDDVAWATVQAAEAGYLVSFTAQGPGHFQVFTKECAPLGSIAWSDPLMAGLVVMSDRTLQLEEVPSEGTHSNVLYSGVAPLCPAK